ncbi:hypothetical protein K6L44_07580, partial [Gluconacetobacter entanii]|nr:hypothetical protein [Gluconacetobacter entanii]
SKATPKTVNQIAKTLKPRAKRINQRFFDPSRLWRRCSVSSRIRTRYGTTNDHSSSDTSEGYGLRVGVIQHY